MRVRPLQTALTLSGLACAVLAATFGYRLLRAEVVSTIYRDRLDELAQEYGQLRESYNEAVSRTAVTELIVEGGRLDVRIRTAAGEVMRVPTTLDPSSEVYVDYVVIDGRLWIRRVFDASTPPSSGVLIDPSLACVDWASQNVRVGKAVYRLLEPGCWVITVTGNGSLGLERAPGGMELASPPQVRDYGTVSRDAAEDAQAVGLADVWSVITR